MNNVGSPKHNSEPRILPHKSVAKDLFKAGRFNVHNHIASISMKLIRTCR